MKCHFVLINIENYTTLCTLEVDISQLPMSYHSKYSGEGTFYRVDYDIVLLFGLTELQAMVAWKENVGHFFALSHPFCLQNIAGRAWNEGVQRRLYTNPISRTITPKIKGISVTTPWFCNSFISDFLFAFVLPPSALVNDAVV